MESEAKRPRRLAFAAIIAAVLAVAALTGTLMGCAPSAPASDAGGSGTAAAPAEQEAGGDDAMAGQPVNWTMESDCVTCHTAEAASATDSACPQGVAHEAEGVTCVTCHTDEAGLASARRHRHGQQAGHQGHGRHRGRGHLHRLPRRLVEVAATTPPR
ncbi:MAG: hypothetical protein ACLUVF_10170 [Adlercreutzia sp.]